MSRLYTRLLGLLHKYVSSARLLMVPRPKASGVETPCSTRWLSNAVPCLSAYHDRLIIQDLRTN